MISISLFITALFKFSIIIYVFGFILSFSAMFLKVGEISHQIGRKIEFGFTDKDKRVREYFANLAETKGEDYANKKFNTSILFLLLIASAAWPFILFDFFTKSKD